jgi:hypothetical protein
MLRRYQIAVANCIGGPLFNKFQIAWTNGHTLITFAARNFMPRMPTQTWITALRAGRVSEKDSDGDGLASGPGIGQQRRTPARQADAEARPP